MLTSQLSVALVYGLLDIIEIFNDLLCVIMRRNMSTSNMILREIDHVLMTQYPETSYQAFKPKYRQIKWSQNEANFNAWCEGQTGFP